MKAIKIILICILSLAIFLYILLPFGFGFYAALKKVCDVGSPPDGFDEVQIVTEDKVQLEAWYKAPENGSVILLLHGANSSRESIRSYAQMLSNNRFGVLAFDLRGHGESSGSGNSFGWNSTLDIGAALAYLESQADVKLIGGLGLSMGGEALLGAISSYPQIKAVAADGATERTINDYLVLPSKQSLVRSWSTRIMYVSVALISGDTAPIRLVDSIREAKETRLLLIAAGKETDEIEYNEFFLTAAGNRAEIWVVPGATHIGAYGLDPKKYEQRLVQFFSDTLV